MASDHFSFNPIAETDDPNMLELLDHPQKWFLECKYGCCSCHFRHGTGSFHPTTKETFPPTFGPPEDWMAEDAEDIEATLATHDVLARLLKDGHQADLIDCWYGASPKEIVSLDVNLDKVPRDHFRFFENYKFTFSF